MIFYTNDCQKVCQVQGRSRRKQREKRHRRIPESSVETPDSFVLYPQILFPSLYEFCLKILKEILKVLFFCKWNVKSSPGFWTLVTTEICIVISAGSDPLQKQILVKLSERERVNTWIRNPEWHRQERVQSDQSGILVGVLVDQRKPEI